MYCVGTRCSTWMAGGFVMMSLSYYWMSSVRCAIVGFGEHIVNFVIVSDFCTLSGFVCMACCFMVVRIL